MPSTTIRISQRARAVLKALARKQDCAMQSVLERALDDYRRKQFLEDVNAGYAKLRRDRAVWKDVQSERALWDRTLADGLSVREPRPRYTASKRKRRKRR